MYKFVSKYSKIRKQGIGEEEKMKDTLTSMEHEYNNLSESINPKTIPRNPINKRFPRIEPLYSRVIDYNSVNLFTSSYKFDFRKNNPREKNLERYYRLKKEHSKNSIDLSDYYINSNAGTFINNLIDEKLHSFSRNELTYDQFLSESLSIIEKYKRFINKDFISLTSLPLFYRIHNEYKLLYNLINWDLIRVDYSLLHEIEFRLKRRVVNSELLFKNFGLKSILNGFIQDNLEEYKIFLDKKIIEVIYDFDYSFIYGLFKKRLSSKEVMDEFPKSWDNKSKSYFYSKKNEKPISTYLAVWNGFSKNTKAGISRGVPLLNLNKGEKRELLPFNNFLEKIISEIFNSIVIDSQNEFRESKGLPKIGEGWISETYLFYQIKSHFTSLEVIQHGKPNWLGKQHVDVWIPDYQIGIEYHGTQHFEPVDFFGGQKIFEKTQERDARKRRLFEENGCILIEIRQDYVLKELIDEIERYIQNHK
jgi:hypothetical protein